MTLIAYNPEDKVVCVESLHSWHDGLTVECTKILKEGLYVSAYAGDGGGAVLVAKAVELIEKGDTCVELPKSVAQAAGGCEAIIRKLEYANSEAGEVFFVQCHNNLLIVEKLNNTFIATGSGAPYMRAYLAEHGDFYKAFELAKLCSAGCGGPTERF